MQVWQDTFKELKDQYMIRSAGRIEQIQQLLSTMARNPADLNNLRELMRQFHWLAGSGGIYGFPQISKLGAHGEAFCEEIAQENRPITRTEWEKCQAIFDALKLAFNDGEDGQRVTMQRELPVITPPTPPPADVIVVDADVDQVEKLTRLMDERGMVARACRTGSAALKAIHEQLPKAMIIAIPLPDIDSYGLVEKIRQVPKGNEIVIYTVSKKSGFLDKVKAIHCGADAYFEVPVDYEALVHKLQYMLERNQPSNYRVLSVEDDPDQAEFIRAVLQSTGYQVTIIPDPNQFEEYMVSVNPDLVLLDIMLGSMTGYELARYLRQDDRWAMVPIIFLTTENQLYAHIQTAQSGADEHLIKPVPPPLLLNAVASRLERMRFFKSLLHRDGLTHLLTHGAFMEEAQKLVAHAKRNPERMAAMMVLDLDHLSKINQAYGYAAGDRVLVNLATLLRQRCRQSDTIGRIGGEEFVAIVEDLEEKNAVHLAKRLLQDFSSVEHRAADGTPFQATFSAGIAMLDPKTMDAEKWKRIAEQALKAAKSAGRKNVMRASLSRR